MKTEIIPDRNVVNLDSIYWLHPADRGNSIRMMTGKTVAAVVCRSDRSTITVRVPRERLFEIARRSKSPEIEIISITNALKASMTVDAWECRLSFPAVNSGVVRAAGSTYNLQRNLFVVPHLKQTADGEFVVIWSLKNTDGWEIGTANTKG